MNDAPPRLIEVARFSAQHEAQIAKARLTLAGIACSLAGEHVNSLSGFFLYEVRLLVAENDAEAARAALAEEAEGEPPEAERPDA